MKKISYFLLLAWTVLLFNHCKPTELPSPQQETPKFFAQFNWDQEPRFWEAGRDHFFQFSDYYLDTNDIYVFRSLLAKDDFCTGQCQESLLIEIRHTTQSNGQLPDWTQALRLQDYHIAQATDTLATVYKYDFHGSVVGTNQLFQKKVHWGFSSEIDTVPLDLTNENISIELTENIPFRVKLDVTDAYGAKGSKEIQLLPGGHTGISLNMTGNAITPTLQASPDTNSQPIGGFSWTPMGTGNLHPITPGQAYTNYCVSGKDAQNHEVTTCGEYARLFGQNIFCTAQINWTKVAITQLDHLWRSSVRIIYQDSQGQAWTSFAADQANSSFVIDKIDDYKKTDAGIQTKMITAHFSVRVTNGSLTKNLNGKSVFAVGIPE